MITHQVGPMCAAGCAGGRRHPWRILDCERTHETAATTATVCIWAATVLSKLSNRGGRNAYLVLTIYNLNWVVGPAEKKYGVVGPAWYKNEVLGPKVKSQI